MNRTQIEWTDFTWNPITGCKHECRYTYCYNTMKNTAVLNRYGAKYRYNGGYIVEKDWKGRETGGNHIALKGEVYPYGYDPTYYPHRLDEPAKKRAASRIFVVDTGDLFGNWVPGEWIEAVLSVARQNPQHIFQFLTKNPRRLGNYQFSKNCWIGTSVNTDNDSHRVDELRKAQARIKYLSIEPLLSNITFSLTDIDWIIIGAQTGKNAKKPETRWVENITERIKVPVFLKNNLQYAGTARQEFPVEKSNESIPIQNTFCYTT